MKGSDLLVAGIWVYFMGGAYLQGRELPHTQLFQSPLPQETVLIILIFPFAFSLPAAFFQRHKVLEFPLIGRYVDSRYGEGAHRRFMIRLRPVLLFMLSCCTLGITGLVSTNLSTQSMQAYVLSGFFVSGSLGLLSAYLLSMAYPPKLC
jgi:hypothetical protein